MDPLSDALRAVRLNGAFFYLVEATHPWSVRAAPAGELVARALPEAEHLLSYHVLLSGSCWGGLEGEPPVPLEPGDALVFPHGDPHLMSSEAGRLGDAGVLGAPPGRHPATVRIGQGEGPRATFVCGLLGCDARPSNPLLSALPRRLLARGIAAGSLAELLRQIAAEPREERPGSETVLTRMAELLLIEVLRRHLAEPSPLHLGWLAGLRDPVVGPALSAIHGRPARPWTLVDLARASGTSRTVLAERFSQLVGVPPKQYLTQWRLQLAAEQLARGSAKVSAIGGQVGYESEAAFSRAFKRATGRAPAAWRRARQRGC